jgi:hypothetical protein
MTQYEAELLNRIKELERKTGSDTYTFETYDEYYVDDDRTVYGCGGGNYSGWREKITSRETGLTYNQANNLATKCHNKRYHITQE